MKKNGQEFSLQMSLDSPFTLLMEGEVFTGALVPDIRTCRTELQPGRPLRQVHGSPPHSGVRPEGGGSSPVLQLRRRARGLVPPVPPTPHLPCGRQGAPGALRDPPRRTTAAPPVQIEHGERPRVELSNDRDRPVTVRPSATGPSATGPSATHNAVHCRTASPHGHPVRKTNLARP
ncbi:uncharacterized protein LOC126978231 isoform X2 [Leptidea sinapis]|uniref:uncharacterized protein LOC126978231 isoform X2 n=1 Tax=Leptidea sinapis TaxID=189913 RepID=UPI0021C31BE0|nr:uncharacterized protein LOC126978231 isoform X2 [Leptidea sinapis]